MSFVHINWRDVQIKNVVNNVDMSSLRAPWQNGPYKTYTQNDTKTRTTSWRNRHLEKKTTYFVFFGFFFFIFFFIQNFLNEFSKTCWVTALVRSMTYVFTKKNFSFSSPENVEKVWGLLQRKTGLNPQWFSLTVPRR